MPLPRTRLSAVCQQVLAIVAGGVEDAPKRQYVAQNLPAFDCAEIVVGVDRLIGHSGDLSIEDTSALDLGTQMRAADLSVWVVRCVPTQDEADDPPTPAALNASADVLLADPIDVLNALTAAYYAGEISGCRGLALLGWDAITSQGGVGGGVQRIRLDLTAV